MRKSNTGNAGNANAKNAPGKRGVAKRTALKRETSTKTQAQQRSTGAAKQSTARGARKGTAKTKQQGRQEAGPASLKPIRSRQNRAQIIATVAADSGIEPRTVEKVARSLSTTLTRHLIRDGSGRVEIPYLGAALWRGRQAAQKARTMLSPLLKREVTIPARRAMPVPRLKIHRAFRETVART